VAEHPLAPGIRWRVVPTRANGQLAFGHYMWDADAGAFHAHGISVLTLRGTEIEDMTIFRTPELLERFGLPATMDGDQSRGEP
jgi:hypothetical protein